MVIYDSKLQVCERRCEICNCWTKNVVTEGEKILHVLCEEHANDKTIEGMKQEADAKLFNEIGIIRIVASEAHHYYKSSIWGGAGWTEKAISETIEKFKLHLTDEQISMANEHVRDLDAVYMTTPRNPYTKGSDLYMEAVEAGPRIDKFVSGDKTVYKKKRYKTPPVKKGHRKHHPDSTEMHRGIPWNVFNKSVRAKLTRQENQYTKDDSLYCCWEEDWTLPETVDECKEAYEAKKDIRS